MSTEWCHSLYSSYWSASLEVSIGFIGIYAYLNIIADLENSAQLGWYSAWLSLNKDIEKVWEFL